MKLYYKIMLNAIQSSMTYRFHTLVTTLNQILQLLVNISLWMALYKGLSVINNNEISLQQMITYTIISTVISIVVSNSNIWTVSNKVQTGEIAINLIRPIGLFRATLSEQLGNKIFSIIFETTPILLLGILVFKIDLPSFIYFLLFLVALVFSYFIFFLMTFLLGLLSFWYLRVFHLDFVLGHAIRFFSGAWIPLWFFPDLLYRISMILPFELIYFSPITIFLEQVSITEISLIFIKSIIYIVILALMNIFVWRIGINRLVIQGG